MNRAVLFLQIILQFLEVRLLNQECMSMPISSSLFITRKETTLHGQEWSISVGVLGHTRGFGALTLGRV